MAKARTRKQDIAWRYLFDRFDIPKQIEQNGAYEITSSDINKYVREYYADRPDNAPDARNLLKFDLVVTCQKFLKIRSIRIFLVKAHSLR